MLNLQTNQMAESHKNAASTSGSQKKSSSLDENFGDDFLADWKSTKVGKDSIDFDVDTVPRNGKKSFNFDKLDDFELGGGFDKISSFKMDMSDLDFSIPLKKADKPKEKCAKESEKQNLKQSKFSFSFDFNELDRFSLDSDLLKGKKIPGKCTDGDGPDCSIKHNKDQNSRSNSVTSTDAFQNTKAKRVATSDTGATSNPSNLIEPEKQLDIADEENVDTNTEVSAEHSNRASPKIPYAEKDAQVTFHQSISDIGSADEAPKLLKGFPSSDPLNADSAKERDNCMRSIDSPQSSNSCPIPQGRQAEVIGGRTNLGERTQGQKDGEYPSDTDVSQKNLDESKTSEDKKNPSSMILSPSRLRDSGVVKPMTVKEKPTPVFQLKSLNKSAGNVSQPTSLLVPEERHLMHNRRIESMILYRANEKRELKENEQSDDQKNDILKSFDRATTKCGPSNLGRGKDAKNADAFRLTKLSITTPKSTMHKEAKSSRLSEENLRLPLSRISTVTNLVVTEKTALMNSTLKRKSLEETKEDPAIQNPRKRLAYSSTEKRKSLEASPNFNRKVVPSPETCHNNARVDHIISPSSDIMASMMNFEVPVLVENDGNVEKAEACAKELDDICNMLKKKHEEAKELLVRVIVNNNALLMLNHPMFDDKIRAVQKFAASLQSKEF